MVFLRKDPSDPRLVRMLKSALMIAFGAVVIVIVATIIIGVKIEYAKMPPLLGNRPENIKNVEAHIDPNNFTFIVIGDVKDSTRTFESLLDLAQLENPSFIIILGDLVSHRSIVDHKLFAYELSEYASKIPFFIVPGNHDINPADGFDQKDFEQFYGPSQFYFTIGTNLFIFLNDLPEYNPNGEYLDFLENVLKSNAQINKKTFVFTHVPPGNLSVLLQCSAAPQSKKLYDIAKKYNIDYIFAGDHHGYVKTVKDGTNYIVSGGGGSRLRGTKGAFHHFVELDVENNNVSERVITVQHKSDGLELLERNIATYFWATGRENKLVLTMGILYCCVASFTFIIFFKRKKE